MKLGNVFTTVNGVTKGQAAVGESDDGCLDVKARGSSVLRDITEIVITDAAGAAQFRSKRLVVGNDYKYIDGPLSSAQGALFNNNTTNGALDVCYLDITFKLTNLSAARNLWNNQSGYFGYRYYITTGGLLYYDCYGGSSSYRSHRAVSSYVFQADRWYHLLVYGKFGSSRNFYLYVDDASLTATGGSYRNASDTARNAYIGSAGVVLRGAVAARSLAYGGAQRAFAADIEDGTVGQAFSATNDGVTFASSALVQQAIRRDWI